MDALSSKRGRQEAEDSAADQSAVEKDSVEAEASAVEAEGGSVRLPPPPFHPPPPPNSELSSHLYTFASYLAPNPGNGCRPGGDRIGNEPL